MKQVKTIEALIKLKEDGVLDPESEVEYKTMPPTPAGAELCRVHYHRDGETYVLICPTDSPWKLKALCQEYGFDFVGVLAVSYGLDEPMEGLLKAIKDKVGGL